MQLDGLRMARKAPDVWNQLGSNVAVPHLYIVMACKVWSTGGRGPVTRWATRFIIVEQVQTAITRACHHWDRTFATLVVDIRRHIGLIHV